MKLLIDTDKETIEVYESAIDIGAIPVIAPFLANGYTVIRIPYKIGTAPEVIYNSNTTEDVERP